VSDAASRPWLAKVDYLVFRSQDEPRDLVETMRPLFTWTGLPLHLDPTSGHHGYRQGGELLLGGARIGRMDWGGETMRGWVRVDIPGQGCGFIDWTKMPEVTMHGELRRCDPCVTFYDGSVTHEMVLQAYRDGGFLQGRGGRPPKCRRIEPEGDPWAGRTIYVGTRGGFKFLRAYEKGLEVLEGEKRKPAPDDAAVPLVDGWPARDVYRLEVEFHAEGRVSLPWAMLGDPLGYWRGAYPFLALLLPGEKVPLSAPEKLPKVADLEVALANIRRQFGSVLYTALVAHAGDIGAVFDKVCGTQHSERLVRAGAMIDVGAEVIEG
jgi:DNA relaxase NicK